MKNNGIISDENPLVTNFTSMSSAIQTIFIFYHSNNFQAVIDV